MTGSMNVAGSAALVMAMGLGAPVAAQAPTFDCSKAQSAVETLICKDADLSSLDRTLHDVYRASLEKAPSSAAARLRAEQRGFISGRNECWKASSASTSLTATWKATSVQECVSGNYKLRISDLQAQWQLVPARAAVTYSCGSPANTLSAKFFETDPATVRVTRAGKTQTLWQVRSGSGARYEGQNVEFWSKGREVTVTWLDETLQCTVR